MYWLALSRGDGGCKNNNYQPPVDGWDIKLTNFLMVCNNNDNINTNGSINY
jgi:hypothetical protein